jgi:hypothetical protein
VKVLSIVEMFNVPPTSTRLASQDPVSDQSPQAFKESLLAVSSVLPSARAANEAATGHLQKAVSEASKLPSAIPNLRAGQLSARPLQIAPQQLPVAQQRPLINPALLSMQFSVVEPILSARTSTVVADRPAPAVPPARFSALAWNLLRPAGAEPDSVTSSHPRKESDPPQVASILPSIAHLPMIATNVSNAVVNPAPNPSLSIAANAVPKADASAVADAVPSVLPDVVQKLTPDSIPSAAQKVIPSPVTSVISNTVSCDVMSTVTVAEPVGASSPDSSLPPMLPPTVIPGADPGGALSAVPSAVPSAIPGAVLSPVEHSASPVVRNEIPNASLNAFPVSALRGVVNPSPKGDIVPKSSPVPITETNPPSALDPTGLATSLNMPDAAANQLRALIQPGGGGLLVTAQVDASTASPAELAKPAATTAVANDAIGLKQHAQSVSDTVSPETALSGDQSQSAASQQGQSTALAQSVSVSHTIAAVDHTPDAVVTPPLQTASTLVGVAGHAAKTSDTAAPATIVLPQAASVINSAKLIQSIGQTEMRVGLRSNDFGNISISTSATRDLISAQISLDHGELARTLAVHLPEMQARFGGAQAMDVRIDMNGQATGQGAGTAASMSDGSAADGSRGERQQKGSAASRESSDSFAGPGNSISAATMISGEARLNGGLDIRI